MADDHCICLDGSTYAGTFATIHRRLAEPGLLVTGNRIPFSTVVERHLSQLAFELSDAHSRCAPPDRRGSLLFISFSARCITLPKNCSPSHTNTKDVEPSLSKIEQKGVEQRADNILRNDDQPEPCCQSGTSE